MPLAMYACLYRTKEANLDNILGSGRGAFSTPYGYLRVMVSREQASVELLANLRRYSFGRWRLLPFETVFAFFFPLRQPSAQHAPIEVISGSCCF